MHEVLPLPSAAERALEVQHTVNNLLARAAEDVRGARFRMRAGDLDPRSPAAYVAASATLSRVSDLEHECARIRELVGTPGGELAP